MNFKRRGLVWNESPSCFHFNAEIILCLKYRHKNVTEVELDYQENHTLYLCCRSFFKNANWTWKLQSDFHDFIKFSAKCQLQLTLVISTPLISILSLMSNWFLSPDYFPYVFIVFQLRVCRTTFMSTLRLSCPSFSIPEYIFHSFYYRVSRTRTMTKEKNVRCGAAGLAVNENHNRPLINKSIF